MKRGIMIVSLEMPSSQILDRLIAKIGNLPMRMLAEGVKSEVALRNLKDAMEKLDQFPLSIRDDLHDLHEIVAAARAMAKSKDGLAVLMVDYIQLVRVNLGKDSSREREVAEVSRALRLLGLELGCLVIGITQLNEQGKARESRSIQQDATSVVIVKVDQENGSERRTISIPIQRNGPCGVQTSMRYSGQTASFVEQ